MGSMTPSFRAANGTFTGISRSLTAFPQVDQDTWEVWEEDRLPNAVVENQRKIIPGDINEFEDVIAFGFLVVFQTGFDPYSKA